MNSDEWGCEMAILKTEFDLGQHVWSLHQEAESARLPCRFCRGSRWLPVLGRDGDETSVQCPRCDGNGVLALVAVPRWSVRDEELVIGSIEVRVFDHSREGTRSGVADNRDPGAERQDEERYMCWATGVGSGTVYDQGRSTGRLYAARSEAEEAAEERNDAVWRGEGWTPNQQQVAAAQGFLDHRDAYEHDASHIALAQRIVAAGTGEVPRR